MSIYSVMSTKSKQNEEFGGHDFDFVDNIIDRYKCTVCTKVLRDPELTVCCGQHFCGTCLLQWFKSQHNKSCPHCRAEGSKFQHVENKSLKSEINQLQIKCSKKSLGCEWTGELGDLKDHLKAENGCSFAEVQCTNKCGSKVVRSRLEDHMNNDCKLRQDNCQYCSRQDTFAAISEHKSICPKFPLLCPNGCCFDTFCREDMPNHMKICPSKKLVCPFEEAGCATRGKPEELEGHMKSNLQQHLTLLLEANKQTRAELQTTNAKLDETAKELTKITEERAKEREGVKAMKKALIFEVKALDESKSGEMRSAAYESIQTQLEEVSDIMEKSDTTVFRMLNISEHIKDSSTWYSSPFLIKQYKLCLAVHPKGIRSGFGSYASLSLILLKIESSPTESESSSFSSMLSSIHILVPLMLLGAGKLHRVFLSGVCGSSVDLSPLADGENKRILGTREEWLPHGILSKELWNDSLVIKIERTGTFSDLHAAALAHAMAGAHMTGAHMAGGQGVPVGECKQS